MYDEAWVGMIRQSGSIERVNWLMMIEPVVGLNGSLSIRVMEATWFGWMTGLNNGPETELPNQQFKQAATSTPPGGARGSGAGGRGENCSRRGGDGWRRLLRRPLPGADQVELQVRRHGQ